MRRPTCCRSCPTHRSSPMCRTPRRRRPSRCRPADPLIRQQPRPAPRPDAPITLVQIPQADGFTVAADPLPYTPPIGVEGTGTGTVAVDPPKPAPVFVQPGIDPRYAAEFQPSYPVRRTPRRTRGPGRGPRAGRHRRSREAGRAGQRDQRRVLPRDAATGRWRNGGSSRRRATAFRSRRGDRWR